MAKPGKQQPRYEVITQETEDGDLIIPLPIPLLKKLGWKEGDNVDIGVDKFGKLFLKKADT
jgi:bifunctional DNA-binding transcriptional regulator/antitoxin component of YhaV-PrlF toxin-antitoxin module